MAITKKKKEEEGEEEKKWKKISVDRGQDVEILEPLCIADAIIIFFVLLQSATPVLCGHKDETGYNEDKVR